MTLFSKGKTAIRSLEVRKPLDSLIMEYEISGDLKCEAAEVNVLLALKEAWAQKKWCYILFSGHTEIEVAKFLEGAKHYRAIWQLMPLPYLNDTMVCITNIEKK